MKNIARLVAGWLIAFVVCGAGLWLAWRYTPTEHNPFAPFSLNDPIGAATYGKLTGLKDDPDRCFAALDAAGIAYTRLEDTRGDTACGLKDALTLDQTQTPYSAVLSMTCIEAAALYVWEVGIARPAAERRLGSPITRIETYGSFACRKVAGTGRWSEHARGNAIDIWGVRLKDGRRLDVKSHWGEATPEGRFLADLHRGGCRLFSVTLGPDYNRAHADHFHFDMGQGDICR